MSKKLVAYFSATGTTAKVAHALAEAIGADVYEIEPAVPYTAADLDWTNKKSRSSIEMNNKSQRPALKEKALEVAAYDTIFVGFPIWWYVAPTLINTFLEAHMTGAEKQWFHLPLPAVQAWGKPTQNWPHPAKARRSKRASALLPMCRKRH